MILNLKQIFSIVGDSREIACEIPIEELNNVKGCNFSTPVRLNGKVHNRAGVVYLDYTASFGILHACDRCLKEYEKEYKLPFDHIVVPSVSSDDNDDYIVADGESIDLTEIALTDILLQLPVKNLCKEDCKGLCMVCGCDLNEKQCDCLN